MRLCPTPSFDRGAAALRRFALVGVAAALGTLAAVPAQAAVVVGTFDPAFGASIANLGYRGTVTLDVPAACFALSPGLISNGNPCSGGTIVVLSSTVEFYNLQEPSLPTFASQSFSFGALAVSSIVTGSGSTLLGVNTSASAPQFLTLFDDGPDGGFSTADDVNYNGEFTLNFLAIDPLQQTGNGPFYTAGMTAACRPTSSANACETFLPVDSNRAVMEFSLPQLTVPEPGGLALVMGALGAALVARRRRG